MASIALLLIGLLLVFLEFFLPGGVMGSAGGIFIVGSVILFASSDYGILATLAFIASAITGTVLVIRMGLKRVREAPPESGLYSDSDQEGYHASEYDQDIVGEQGAALSDLKPSGHITVHNRRYQAVSQSGYIKEGTPIKVVGGRGAHLIVTAIEEE